MHEKVWRDKEWDIARLILHIRSRISPVDPDLFKFREAGDELLEAVKALEFRRNENTLARINGAYAHFHRLVLQMDEKYGIFL